MSVLVGRIGVLRMNLRMGMDGVRRAGVSTCGVSCQQQNKDAGQEKERKINKAMRSYLERATDHDNFMKKQVAEFQIGKRHLANMMGENPETFTQEDIDMAIRYLFPSGVYDKAARPMMRPPEEIFPQRKAAEFDEQGRPRHYLFYTGRPGYYEVLHNAVVYMKELDTYEDEMIRKGQQPEGRLDLTGSDWLKQDQFEKTILETLKEQHYKQFVMTMERLSEHPYAYRVKDFIFKYRKPFLIHNKSISIPEPVKDETGRLTVKSKGNRKKAMSETTVWSPGTGKIKINGQDLSYFEDVQSREQAGAILCFLTLLLFLSLIGRSYR